MKRRAIVQLAAAVPTWPNRRRCLILAALALGACPRIVVSQASRQKKRVGMLHASNPEATKQVRAAFTARLTELGWREGINIEYLWRYAQSDSANYERLAADMVARRPDIIFASYGPFAVAVKKHTRDIPIVFTNTTDPVGQGLVASLAHPGGNATGASTRSHELAGKRLQLLKEMLPQATKIGVVRRVGVASFGAEAAIVAEELKRAATHFGLQLIEVEHEHREGGELGPAFARLVAQRVDAVASLAPWNWLHAREFGAHAVRARLPAICDASEFVHAGGLISLSVSFAERYRKSAEFVDRILRGAKPAELPVEEPTVFELVVNLRTARELGITIPKSILLRADRVIE